MAGRWNTNIDRKKLIALYADWLDLIAHLVSRFKVDWPNNEVWCHVDGDNIHVRWRFGYLGRMYLENGRVCFSSNARLELKELDADVPGLEFHEALQPIRGWRSDDGRRSDIEYCLWHFWSNALEEAQLRWEAQRAVEALFDDIR
jgi:hypothetical protein